MYNGSPTDTDNTQTPEEQDPFAVIDASAPQSLRRENGETTQNVAAQLRPSEMLGVTMAFDQFLNSPDRAALETLLQECFWYAQSAQESGRQEGWERPHEKSRGWFQIRAAFDRVLTTEQSQQASGAIGYALREVLHGDRLSEPRMMVFASPSGSLYTVLEYDYDSNTIISSQPDPPRAFERASQYIVEGSPLRLTDRSGPGTAGTRLVQGIGPVRVTFSVR
jgi:hypothetical protein